MSSLALTEFRGEIWVSSFWAIIACQRELTEFFFAELTEFAAELSESSLPKQYSRNSILPASYIGDRILTYREFCSGYFCWTLYSIKILGNSVMYCNDWCCASLQAANKMIRLQFQVIPLAVWDIMAVMKSHCWDDFILSARKMQYVKNLSPMVLSWNNINA